MAASQLEFDILSSLVVTIGDINWSLPIQFKSNLIFQSTLNPQNEVLKMKARKEIWRYQQKRCQIQQKPQDTIEIKYNIEEDNHQIKEEEDSD